MNAPTLEPFDFWRLPIVAVATISTESVVMAVEIHDWAGEQVKVCHHTRDFVQSCRVCRDVIAVINALDSGAAGVRVVPRRDQVKS